MGPNFHTFSQNQTVGPYPEQMFSPSYSYTLSYSQHYLSHGLSHESCSDLFLYLYSWNKFRLRAKMPTELQSGKQLHQHPFRGTQFLSIMKTAQMQNLHFFKTALNLAYRLWPILPEVLFLSVFPTKFYIHFSPLLCALHSLSISYSN